MAIDRKELRLGNLVDFRPFGENEQKVWVCRIDTMYSESVNLTYGSFGVRGVEYERLSPIEITPEILEKNGFEYKYGTWHFVRDVNPELRYDVIYRMEDSWIHAASQNYRAGKNLHTCMTTAKYLHQFQNALWAAHINKEVTI